MSIIVLLHYTATALQISVSDLRNSFKNVLNVKQKQPYSTFQAVFNCCSYFLPSSNEGCQTARRISVSKLTAPGKGLQVMCLEGEAYSLCCHHWCMSRS